jgi:peptide/nickel transport system permease protein
MTAAASAIRRFGSALRQGGERSAGAALLLACAMLFILVPALTRSDPTSFAGSPLSAPSWSHPFGTDQLGRDVFARVFAAGMTDLTITVACVGASLAIGTALGLLLVVSGRAVREVALRLVDAFLAIPYMLLVLLLAVGVGDRLAVPGLPSRTPALILAIVVSGWAPYTRFAVARGLSLRERESVVAAQLLGYGRLRILLRHVAPDVASTNLSYAATQAVATLGGIASLAFLGVGIGDPHPELGQMMQQGISLLPVAWWISLIPGLAILVLGTGFGLIADSFGQDSGGQK